MMSVGAISYTVAAIGYLLLTLLAIISYKGRLVGKLFILATFVTFLWSSVHLGFATAYHDNVFLVLIADSVKNVVWLFFLSSVLYYQRLSHHHSFLYFLFIVLTFLNIAYAGFIDDVYAPGKAANSGLPFFFTIINALLILVLIEQLFRNLREEKRWAIKYFCFAIGSIYVYEMFMFSHAFLFREMDAAIWDARGLVNALAIPLFAVSAARTPDWSVDIFISRKAVFYTTTVFASGLYLLIFSIGAYYIRVFGGEWGDVFQIIFIYGAILLLVIFLFSSNLRAKLRIFLSKHFFSYKYDYREEWLRLMRILSFGDNYLPLHQRVIKAVAQIVESPRGILWLADNQGSYKLMTGWNHDLQNFEDFTVDDDLVRFLKTHKWVIDLYDVRNTPNKFENLHLVEWLEEDDDLWLVVPVIQEEDLLGFIMLYRPYAKHSYSWEDFGLLNTVGRQIGSYIALQKTAEELAEVKQFEIYNRLSTFILHDLKNLVTQLDLINKNAQKHKHNPEFIEDVFETIDNVTQNMKKLMSQLKRRDIDVGNETIKLAPALESIINKRKIPQPQPQLIIETETAKISANPERLHRVMSHLLQNAQEATGVDGQVSISLQESNDVITITVTDDGIGMTNEYIKDKLFKPFETTKPVKGMGIGVYEAKEFIRELGGMIEVHSKIDEGTRFEITLPKI